MVNTWSPLNRLCCKGFASLVNYFGMQKLLMEWFHIFALLARKTTFNFKKLYLITFYFISQHFIVEAVVFMSQQPCGLEDSLSLRETFNNHHLKKLLTENLILRKNMSMFIVRSVGKTPFFRIEKN